MKARDLMVRPVATARIDDSLAHAAALMRDHGCGAVVVLGARSVVAAMLTDRDICMGALRGAKPLADLRVGAAMSKKLHACSPDDDVARATRMQGGLVLPTVRASEVGRTLGDIARPHLAGIEDADEQTSSEGQSA